MKVQTRAAVNKLIIYAILFFMAFIMLVPFAWMILTAVKTNQESVSVDPFFIFPQGAWNWGNFATVWESYNFLVLYKNTLLMIVLRIVCACLTATMAGYAFGRLRFPGKNFMFSLILVQMMIPVQIFIIPQYLMVSKLGWMNTTMGLLFPGLVTAFGTYLLKTGYQGLPKDLEEAASIDGANRWQRMRWITFPSLANTIITVLILNLAKIMNLFESVFVLTNNQVTDVSQVLQTYVYDMTFGSGADYGFSTAVGFFRSVVGCLLVIICNYASKKVRGRGIV